MTASDDNDDNDVIEEAVDVVGRSTLEVLAAVARSHNVAITLTIVSSDEVAESRNTSES